jgi:hypothetical protein
MYRNFFLEDIRGLGYQDLGIGKLVVNGKEAIAEYPNTLISKS